MTQHEEAFKEAEKELLQEQTKKIKDFMKTILQKLEDKKKEKADAEEAIRILKLDLEDLRAGKVDKIEERHQSQRVQSLAQIQTPTLVGYSTALNLTGNGWATITAGTYTVSSSNGTSKEYYF